MYVYIYIFIYIIARAQNHREPLCLNPHVDPLKSPFFFGRWDVGGDHHGQDVDHAVRLAPRWPEPGKHGGKHRGNLDKSRFLNGKITCCIW